MDAYRLVGCDFHDRLESLATLRQTCHLVYRSDTNPSIEIDARIVDVYAANQADYIRLADGTEIRIDKILSVDGHPVTYCAE